MRIAKSETGKKYYLNLNNYRNWHFQASNNIKKKYKEIMFPQLVGRRFNNPISITFTLFKGSKRRTDRANILSIVEKFFCDALVFYKCIKDDCDDFIDHSEYYTGGIDRDHPRVEIEIKEIK